MNYKRLGALLLAVTSLSVQAEQRWFEVELLLFKRNVDIQNITEHLSSEEIVVDSSNSINMLKSSRATSCGASQHCLAKRNPTVITSSQFDTQSNNFVRLNSSKLQLTAQREQLQRHASFEPVLHMAWRMPTVSGSVAKPLHIFAGNNLAPRTPVAPQPEAQVTEQPTTSVMISNDGISEIVNVQPPVINAPTVQQMDKWEIDGNFKVYLDHYLFIDSQLIIRKAITEQVQPAKQAIELIEDQNGVQIARQIDNNPLNNIAQQAEQRTVIKEILFDQNRRLRSEEIHYLDHPLIGIIVQIRKIPESELTLLPEELSEQLAFAEQLAIEEELAAFDAELVVFPVSDADIALPTTLQQPTSAQAQQSVQPPASGAQSVIEMTNSEIESEQKITTSEFTLEN